MSKRQQSKSRRKPYEDEVEAAIVRALAELLAPKIIAERPDVADLLLTEEQRKPVPRPTGGSLIGSAPRKMIAFRIDIDVQRALQRLARARRVGYHSLINDVLAAYVAKEQ